PFPEEANRRGIDLLADALFAPTELAARTLLAEGCQAARGHLVGNTGVDALRSLARVPAPGPRGRAGRSTGGPPESFGAPLRAIFFALRRLAESFPDVTWIYPVHHNPNVRRPACELLGGVANLKLLEPVDYRELVAILARCRFVLTDSGGIQEEAP